MGAGEKGRDPAPGGSGQAEDLGLHPEGTGEIQRVLSREVTWSDLHWGRSLCCRVENGVRPHRWDLPWSQKPPTPSAQDAP